jgi:hypothetical protein
MVLTKLKGPLEDVDDQTSKDVKLEFGSAGETQVNFTSPLANTCKQRKLGGFTCATNCTDKKISMTEITFKKKYNVLIYKILCTFIRKMSE